MCICAECNGEAACKTYACAQATEMGRTQLLSEKKGRGMKRKKESRDIETLLVVSPTLNIDIFD